MAGMDRITAEQVRRNRDARQGWNLYQSHRERVTQLLLSAAPSPGAALCVLGAGNCNDLELKRLRQHFRSIHLVDLDTEALSEGCELQGLAGDRAIHCHGGIDVTGVAERMEAWQPQQPAATEEVADVIRDALASQVSGLPCGPFDVVASVGLLTQLIEMVGLTLGTQHPQFLGLMSAIRLRHLRLLLELTRSGGRAWLFCEVVSSLTCPELLRTPESNLAPVLQRAIAQQNFFTGANPAILNRLFQEDPELRASISALESPPPWLWHFFTRTYAVCAFGATKHRG